MNTKTKLCLLALSAAALILNSSTSFGQAFDSVEVLNNRAVAASPRAKEAFPWLTRSAATPVIPSDALGSGTTVTGATKNRAIASSPRARGGVPRISKARTNIAESKRHRACVDGD